MVCLRDRYTCIVFFCLSGIAICLLTLLFFNIPQRLVVDIDSRLSETIKGPVLDAYYKHYKAMPSFLKEMQMLIPGLSQVERYIKPNGTYLKVTIDTPQTLLVPSNLIVCKSKKLMPAQLMSVEQQQLLETIEIKEDITTSTTPTVIDFVLNKAPLLTPYFHVCWHNKTCITLIPYEYINKHRYTIVIDHTYNVNTVLVNLIQQFINFHAEQKKNQKTHHWIVDLRFDDWWIIHTRGLEGVCP